MSAPIVRWYVSSYSRDPERKEFSRETENFLVYVRGGKEFREAKVSSYYRYYEDEARAIAAIDARKRREAERAAEAKVRAAAPELLEALQALAEAADTSDDCQYGTLSTGFVRDIARAAIAKATGAQP